MIIHTTSSVFNPNILIGTTWTRITGKFLLGATDNGSTGTDLKKTANVAPGGSGGEAEHKLTGQESGIAKHRHQGAHFSVAGSVANTGPLAGTPGAIGHWVSDYINNTDASETHNNMPPFLAVYIWERTALS